MLDLAKLSKTLSLTEKEAKIIGEMWETEKVVNSIKQINFKDLNFSNTVLNHIGRPYQESKLLIKEIMESATPILDPQGSGALFWKVEGVFNGRKGTFERLIDPTTNTVWHFLFKRS